MRMSEESSTIKATIASRNMSQLVYLEAKTVNLK